MEIYDPDIETLKEAVKDFTINSNEHRGGIFMGLNKDNSLKCAIWGTPKQLACLYLEIQDRLPEGIIEYANTIRENANDPESVSLEIKTPANRTIN